MRTIIIFVGLVAATLVQLATSHAQLTQNLQTSAAGDLVHPISLEEGQAGQNKLNVRSVELSLFGAIDHIFDGNLTFAGHTGEDGFEFEVHEGYVGSTKLIPLSRFRIGKFLLGVGRLNQYHQHDWPFITAPKVQREFFNPGNSVLTAESAADTGVEYSILLPVPFYLDVTAGVTNGYCYGHCHDEGQRPHLPIHYLRPVTFFELGDGAGLQIGLNYMGREDHAGESTRLTGADVTYKAREGKTVRWLLQSEIWHRAAHNVAGATSTVGTYLYPQYGINEALSFGFRFDAYSQLNRSFSTTGERQNDLDYALVPTLTYKPSEFSTLRIAYAHEVDTTQGEGDVRDRRFDLQLVYLLGAHPAHDF